MRIFLLFVAALFVFSSCTVNQTMTYHADQSGTMVWSIDYSTMAAMSKNDTVPYDPLAGINVDSMVKSINQTEGISEAKLNKDETHVYLSYQFKDLTALNKALNKMDLMNSMTEVEVKPTKNHTFFTAKSNTLTYTAPSLDKTDKEKLSESLLMSAMLTLDMKINLPGKVSKLSNYNYNISSDRKSISYSVTMDKVLSGEVDTDFTVKF